MAKEEDTEVTDTFTTKPEHPRGYLRVEVGRNKHFGKWTVKTWVYRDRVGWLEAQRKSFGNEADARYSYEMAVNKLKAEAKHNGR